MRGTDLEWGPAVGPQSLVPTTWSAAPRLRARGARRCVGRHRAWPVGDRAARR